jgi:hypothetical protein
MFGMGGGGAANEDQAPSADGGAGAGVGAGVGTGVGTGMGTDVGGYPTPPPPPQQDTNEYGDPWLTDEQAGVSSPDDNTSGFFDTLSDFFGDDN